MDEHAMYGEERQRVIETASATTSPDNAQSGHFAFVIAGIALAVLLLFGMGVSGCMSLASKLILDDYTWDDPYPIDYYEQYYDDYLEDTRPFDDGDFPIEDLGEGLEELGDKILEGEKPTQS